MHLLLQSMAALMLITVQLAFAEIPKRYPKIDIGSFEYVLSPIDDISRDVIVYWKNIEGLENNTDDDSLEYRAYYSSVEAENTMDFYPSDGTFANHAIFVGLDLNIEYNIRVYASNKDGLSTNYASINIPSLPNKRKDTVSLTLTKVKTYYEPGVYELSWEIDDSQKLFAANQLNYYTLYWCENDKVHPNQCNGYMDWVLIPSTETKHIVTVPDNWKDYQFAISANSRALQKSSNFGTPYEFKSMSSGMVWELCGRLHQTNSSKVKSFWVNYVSQTSIALRWKLDCSQNKNFSYDSTIMYCPKINSLDDSQCIGPVEYKNVYRTMTQDHAPYAFLSGLKPATTYRIALYMTHVLDGSVIHSVPIYMTTLPEVK